MIEQSTVIRISDGLPLSVSTDSHYENSQAKKIAKHLLPNLSHMPPRICVEDEHFTLHCIHTKVAAFIAVCNPNFSHLMAFSYLEEISQEFNMLYIPSVVAAVRRPYAFTEFDNYMQKLKQQINKPLSPVILANRPNLNSLRTELTLRPPATISAVSILPPDNPQPPPPPARTASSYTAVTIANGNLKNGTSAKDDVYIGVAHLKPLDCISLIFVCLALGLTLLDFYRGISLINDSRIEDAQEELQVSHGVYFIAEFFALQLQTVFTLVYSKLRRLKALFCTVVLIILTVFQLGYLREFWLSALYIFVSISLLHIIWTRKYQKTKEKIYV